MKSETFHMNIAYHFPKHLLLNWNNLVIALQMYY